MSARCCCGKIEDCAESIWTNETRHEPLGPEGNFCGPGHFHEIRDLKRQLAEALDALKLNMEIADVRTKERNEARARSLWLEESVAVSALNLKRALTERDQARAHASSLADKLRFLESVNADTKEQARRARAEAFGEAGLMFKNIGFPLIAGIMFDWKRQAEAGGEKP